MTEEENYHEITSRLLGVETGQLFGKPCYKINKKAFCCFFENAMVFKLNGVWHQKALSLAGSKLFDPSGKGRAMKEWVQVPFDYVTEWPLFAESALKYVKK